MSILEKMQAKESEFEQVKSRLIEINKNISEIKAEAENKIGLLQNEYETQLKTLCHIQGQYQALSEILQEEYSGDISALAYEEEVPS